VENETERKRKKNQEKSTSHVIEITVLVRETGWLIAPSAPIRTRSFLMR